MAEDDQELTSRGVERLIFFSDAVVAIAITLLAIDLPVPAGHTLSAFWSSVQDNEDRYLAFLVSFGAIAAAWSDHHDAFRYTRRMDRRLRLLNMGWLLMIVITPFATRLLTVGSNEDVGVHAVRWGFYALVQTLTSVIMIVILRHMASHQLAPGVTVLDAHQHGLAVLQPGPRLRDIHPGLLRHELRLGALDRDPVADADPASLPRSAAPRRRGPYAIMRAGPSSRSSDRRGC